MPTYYETLGVGPEATPVELRRAYVTLARRYHPDTGGDLHAMTALNEAWAVLADPDRRRAYDLALTGRRRPEPPPRPAGPRVETRCEHPPPEDDPPRWHPLDDDDDEAFFPVVLGAAPARSFLSVVPSAVFMTAVGIGCVAIVLGEPALLAFAGFVFFCSCIAVAAVVMLTLRSSVRGGRR